MQSNGERTVLGFLRFTSPRCLGMKERSFLISHFLATDPEVFTKPGWQISFNPPSDPGCRVGPLLKFAAHIESSNDIAQ